MSSWFSTYGFAEILPGQLLSGAYPTDADDVEVLSGLGVQRVLNLCEESEYPPGAHEAVTERYAELGIAEQRIRLVDFGGLPAEFLDAAASQVSAWLDDGQRTYVHCRAGWQRSATVVSAVIALRQGLDPETAVAFVRAAKPTADPLPHQIADLIAWYDAWPTPPRAGDAP